MQENQLNLIFIDPTCEYCADLLSKIQERGLLLSVCYMVPDHGATFSEAAIQVAVRESCPESFIAFVGLRHCDLSWLAGWQTWKKDAEELALDIAKVEAALPQAVELLIRETEFARALKIPAAPALWDGRVLRVGASCLDEYLRSCCGQEQIADNS